MNSKEIRSRWLKFFADRGHTVWKSDNLVPENDPSLLFTGAGMNQFKDMFMGRGNLPFKRATTVQKCLRLPDLENVGRTPSHHTFFEMLGNFSFGDYFKREAIGWAFEFLTTQINLEERRLLFSVYADDDEAAQIWEKEIGVDPSKIFRYGEDDNFWPASAPSQGPNGPCGPCSEIYYDFEPEKPIPVEGPAVDGKRFVEIWNLVFTQFERKDGGKLEDLPQRNIDTGAGFERLCRVVQGGKTNFDTDLFLPIIGAIAERAGHPYGSDPAHDVRMRRITDHVRAVLFCIADGVPPGNERQCYVVRKVLRRALVDWWNLGIRDEGLEVLVPKVVGIEGLSEQYPVIKEQEERACRLIREDGERFNESFQTGSARLEEYMQEMDSSGEMVLDGRKAFFLWDTVGFPLDLTERSLQDRGFGVDQKGFDAAMEEQREKARRGSKLKGEIFDSGPLAQLKGKIPQTDFIGYDQMLGQATVLAIAGPDSLCDEAHREEPRRIILDRTPFYAESGGQVGDRGRLVTGTGTFMVRATEKIDGYFLHEGEVLDGTLRVGDTIEARVEDTDHRSPIRRNHTATHLLHWALRRVMGSEVEQAGSLVAPDRLRFDFTCSRGLKSEEIRDVEKLVNQQVIKNLQVTTEVKDLQEAKAAGAMALFGEKYEDRVRVVSILDEDPDSSSVELCGGTHCRATGEIGQFRVVSEGSVAAGVRRVEAVTGLGSWDRSWQESQLLSNIAEKLKSDPKHVIEKVESLGQEIRQLRKKLEKSQAQEAGEKIGQLLESGRHEIEGLSLCAGRVDGLDPKALMAAADQIRQKNQDLAAVVLASAKEGKVNLVVSASDDFVARGLKAGDLCREMAGMIGGGGGGNPKMARGQGSDVGRIDDAIEFVAEWVRKKL